MTVRLSAPQRAQLIAEGWCRLPGIVPEARVDAVRRLVLGDLGRRGLPPERMREFVHQSFCPELRSHEEVLALALETDLWPLTRGLLGGDALPPPTRAQIALRFPIDAVGAQPTPHLDGMPTPDNAVPAGQINTFSALLGVYLSQVPGPGHGGFTVWPGTHETYARYLATHGLDALLDGMPEVALPDPVTIVGRAGDGFLVNPLVGHAGGPNWGPRLRMAVFFRLRRRDHESERPRQMLEPWRDWPGLAACSAPSSSPE